MKLKFYIILALLIWALTLVGCSKQVATHKEAVKSIKSNQKVVKIIPKETWNAAQSTGIVDDGWIKTFNDPGLIKIVDEAQQNNFGLKISKAQVEKANALARQAGASLKPTIGLSGAYSDRSSEGLSEIYGTSLKISWEADVWGRMRSGAAGAKEAFSASQSDFEFARQSLAAATANGYFLTIGSKLLSQHANEIVSLVEETLRIVKVKEKVGQGSMKDVHMARANLAAAKEASQSAIMAQENAKRSLELVLGRYPSASIETTDQLIAVLPPVTTGMPSEILERRPDLIAAEQRVAAAFYKQKEAELMHLPRFKFSAGAGVFNLTNAASNLAAGIFAPLYTGGAIEAEVDKATADQKKAIAAYAQAALNAFKEVETSLSADKFLLQREQFLQTIVTENYKAYQLIEIQYEVGKIEFIDVLTVQNKWIQAKIALLDISIQRLMNRVGLHLALGGSFTSN